MERYYRELVLFVRIGSDLNLPCTISTLLHSNILGAILSLLCLTKTNQRSHQLQHAHQGGQRQSFITETPRESQRLQGGQLPHHQKANPRKTTKNKASSTTAGTINIVARDLRSKIASLCSYASSI